MVVDLASAARLGQSRAERDFILLALREGFRADGRQPWDTRKMRLHFSRGHAQSSCEVQLGRTRARCVCTGDTLAPRAGRSAEGIIRFKVRDTRQ